MIDPSNIIFWLITGGCFLASFVNAAFALGGAFIMLALMTSILPINAVIPMHSTLMLGSLISRSWLFREHIHWPIVVPFSIGCVLGVTLGAQVYINLPDWLITLVIGCLMLSIWLPSLKVATNIPKPFFVVGCIHSFISTVFAYGGLFHAVILRCGLNKLQVTATIAGSLLSMALLKMAGYSTFGFDYQPYFYVIFAAIAVSFLGTWFGKRISHHISESTFRILFKSIMTLLGLRLLFQAWQLY